MDGYGVFEDASATAPLSVHRYGDGRGSFALIVSGELDFTNCGRLRDAVLGILDDADCHHLDVDLRALRFIDSSGVNVLIAGMRRADQRQVGYRVRDSVGIVHRVLEIVGVDKALDPPADRTG